MIIEGLTPTILNFLGGIEELGFSLCLVGGYTRDYFYSKTLGNDLDFEIRSREKLNDPIHDWPIFYKKLHFFLDEKKLPFVELPYLITRVNFEGKHFEFSSPRLERDIPDNFSHHHFQAILDPNLSYDLSFKRRDFTINAIGVELNLKSKKETIIDPFEGMKDLKAGILKNINDDFFLDSVRFLRLVRFKLKFEKFTIDEKLLNDLNKFNLSKLSVHHFKEELFKSCPSAFFNKFSELVVAKKLSIPEDFLFWTKYKMPENLHTKDELLAFVFLQNSEDASLVAKFFSMPDKRLKDLKSFFDSYKAVKSLSKNNLTDLISLPLDEALRHPIFKDLKNLEDKKEWMKILYPHATHNELLVNWDDWSAVTVSAEELSQINSPLRSYYKFYKTIRTKFSHD